MVVIFLIGEFDSFNIILKSFPENFEYISLIHLVLFLLDTKIVVFVCVIYGALMKKGQSFFRVLFSTFYLNFFTGFQIYYEEWTILFILTKILDCLFRSEYIFKFRGAHPRW